MRDLIKPNKSYVVLDMDVKPIHNAFNTEHNFKQI